MPSPSADFADPTIGTLTADGDPGYLEVYCQLSDAVGSVPFLVTLRITTPTVAGITLSQWRMGGTSGAVVDQEGRSDLAVNPESLERGLDPLYSGGVNSILCNGSNGYLQAAHHPDYQAAEWTVYAYVEVVTPPSSPAKLSVLDKDGGVGTVGGMAVEIHSDGWRGYVRDSNGVAQWFGGSSGVSLGSAPSTNTAYLVAVTRSAAAGAKLYVQPAGGALSELGTAATGADWGANSAALSFAAFRGSQNFSRIIVGEAVVKNFAMTSGQIDALANPVSITPPAPTETPALVRPVMALATGQRATPGSNVLFVAASGGSNANAGTSEGSPKATLQGAHDSPLLAPGWTIVLLGGRHTLSSTFAPTTDGTSGNPIVVQAKQGATVILDRTIAFQNFITPNTNRWESVDSGLKLWRSVATGFTAGRLRGQWEEDGECYQFYGTTNGGGTSLLGGRAPSGTNYVGPMIWIEGGRVYCRFQKVSPARMKSNWPNYMKGVVSNRWNIPESENPNTCPIYITYEDEDPRALQFGSVTDWHFYDINIQNAGTMVTWGNDFNRISFTRGQWRNARIFNDGTSPNGVVPSGSNVTMSEIQMIFSLWGHWPWGLPKQEDQNYQNFGRYFGLPGQSWNGLTLTDCYFYGGFDFAVEEEAIRDFVVKHCWFEKVWDDTTQWGTGYDGCEWAYNVFNATPGWGCEGHGTSQNTVGNVYFHHNVVAQHRWVWLWRASRPNPQPMLTQSAHGGTYGQMRLKIYNNTFMTQPGTPGYAIQVTMCGGRATATGTAATSHETVNNIFLVISDENGTQWLNEENSPTGAIDHGACRHDLGGNEDHDYNHHEKSVKYAAALSGLLGPFKGQTTTYNSVSAFNSASSGQNWEANGTGILRVGQSDPNASCSLVDAYNLDVRPKISSIPASGARNISGTGWPGATNDTYRGAVDPTTGLCPDGAKPGPRVTYG